MRALASSLLADEADDVVQEVYLRALEQRPEPVRAPRFVVGTARAQPRHRPASRRRQRRFPSGAGGLRPRQWCLPSAELLMAEERPS